MPATVQDLEKLAEWVQSEGGSCSPKIAFATSMFFLSNNSRRMIVS